MKPLTRSERHRNKTILSELSLSADEYRQYRARHASLSEAGGEPGRDTVVPENVMAAVAKPRLFRSRLFGNDFVVFDLTHPSPFPRPVVIHEESDPIILVPQSDEDLSEFIELELIRLHQLWRGQGRGWERPESYKFSVEAALRISFEWLALQTAVRHLHFTHYPMKDVDLPLECLAAGAGVTDLLERVLVEGPVHPDAFGALLGNIIVKCPERLMQFGYSPAAARFVSQHVALWAQDQLVQCRDRMDVPYFSAGESFFKEALALGGAPMA